MKELRPSRVEEPLENQDALSSRTRPHACARGGPFLWGRGWGASAVIDRRYRLNRRTECDGCHGADGAAPSRRAAVTDRRYRLHRR